VRVLGTIDGVSYVLVPRTSWSLTPGRPFVPRHGRNVLCVDTVERAGLGMGPCQTTAQLRAGQSTGGMGHTFWALLPDEVAAVRAVTCHGHVDIPVRENFFHVRVGKHPALPAGFGHWLWLDRHGHPLPTPTLWRRFIPTTHRG